MAPARRISLVVGTQWPLSLEVVAFRPVRAAHLGQIRGPVVPLCDLLFDPSLFEKAACARLPTAGTLQMPGRFFVIAHAVWHSNKKISDPSVAAQK
jgi:hypothetical protein